MRRHVWLPPLLALTGACATEPATDLPIVPGTPVDPASSDAEAAERARVQALLATAKDLTKDALFEKRPPLVAGPLGYDPKTATGLDTITNSRVGLSAPELDALGQRGFVISDRASFPTFAYGYEALYSEHLPLFVSADSILFSVHKSFDKILEGLERASLIGELDLLLEGMRKNLSQSPEWDEAARRDADFYLAVALGLLRGAAPTPIAGADPALVDAFLAKANAASGRESVTIFGVRRDVDFSQFTPRGHYKGVEELERYFRAMIWLGRIDLRLIETQPDGGQVFHRRQLEAALLLRDLVGPDARIHYDRLDLAITTFAGEHDNLTIDEFAGLLADLGATTSADLRGVPDARIAEAIQKGGYGAQRISSHIMINGTGRGTLPLSSTFLLLGQRYTVDSHVFSNVVYDRVQGGAVKRMMPSPLDAAYAALGNDQAAHLLAAELAEFGYASDLEAMRLLVDDHEPPFWSDNLYNLWLSSLRALSPRASARAGLPAVAKTEAWGRRLLNTQLASWAELRHDTILYVKQSYSAGVSCEFPDAYVEPNPEFFARLETYAQKGNALLARLELPTEGWLPERLHRYFARLYEVSSMLREMAEYELAGTPFTDVHLQFINEAVRMQPGCGEPTGVDGWYGTLFFDNLSSVEHDPTIADVHTQPTDEVGNDVGKVLHVGTGNARLMVVTVDTCQGPRAYAGLVSSYFERVTENYRRLDDEAWKTELETATPADVPWLSDLIVR